MDPPPPLEGGLRVKPAAFRYHRAESIEETLDLLSRFGDSAKILAGGQSLVPMMNMRLARPDHIVDISRLPDLGYIASEPDRLRVGALTTHDVIERSQEVRRALPGMAEAASLIGHWPIRCRGTIGGSLAHADPASEWCLLAVLVDAQVEVRSRSASRVVDASAFFTGFLSTNLGPDELLVEVRIPLGQRRLHVEEFSLRAGDFAVVAAAVAMRVEDGLCRDVRIALGGVDTRPIRASVAERMLEGAPVNHSAFTQAAEAAAAVIEPTADIDGSVSYKRELAAVLIDRSLLSVAA
jgi:aerobic carbon-monoxide dehydrogenase medium subunit